MASLAVGETERGGAADMAERGYSTRNGEAGGFRVTTVLGPGSSNSMSSRFFPGVFLSLAAVLCLCGRAWARIQGPGSRAVNAAIDRGVEWLLARQRFDGSWKEGGHARPGETALIAYTLLKSGLSPRHQAVQRVMAHLEGVHPDATYDTALLILALEAFDAQANQDRIGELVEQLLEWKSSSGWGYPVGGDLSNTQYAALGLWAGARAGAVIPERAWYELITTMQRYRGRGGAFSYRPDDKRHVRGSMVAAGVAVLAICRDGLGLTAKGKSARRYKALMADVEAGLEWLDRNWSVSENPGIGRAHLAYYLYGLERAGALVPTGSIGDHDWYQEGARFLLEHQTAEGDWDATVGRGVPSICFALLFLRRATLPVTGGPHARSGRSYDTGTVPGGARIAAAGDNPVGMWLVGLDGALEKRLAWSDGSGAHIERVVWIVDGVEAARIEGDRERKAGAERFEYRAEFEEPGTHTLQAELHLLRPPLVDSRGRKYPPSLKLIRSPVLEVVVENACPEWMLANARDPARNLVPGSLPVLQASSSRIGFPAENAVDGYQERSWVAAENDAEPTLSIEFGNPPLADLLLVGQARGAAGSKRSWGKAVEVEVLINGEPHRVRMYPDVRRKGRLELPRPVRIRQLELSIRRRVPGEGGATGVGLAEVELQLRPRPSRSK